MKKQIYRAGISGAAAGLANGLFGAGGGMLLVPLLTGFCRLEERKCFATAIAVILPLCLVSITVYCLSGTLDVKTAAPYLIGGFFGGLVGGWLLRRLPVRLLHGALGLIILWGGIRLWR